MKKLILGLIAFIFLVAAGLSIYISMIDVNKQKGKIAAEFLAITGHRIVFDGPLTLSWFPEPKVTAANVKIFSTSPKNKQPLMEVPSLVADLSLSPLLEGNLDVSHLSLVRPKIVVEKLEDGEWNWYAPLTDQQSAKLNSVEVNFDSVTFEKAQIKLAYNTKGEFVQLENVNAEVNMQSLLGPYRVDGSFTSNSNPIGFALSLSKLSDRFANTINLAFNYPKYATSLRFDGSFLTQNNALNGNIVIESQKPVDFANMFGKELNIDQKYSYPLATSMELNVNNQIFALNNLIVKYGNTSGAGFVEFPFEKNAGDRFAVKAAFNMTDFDSAPLADLIKDFVTKYRIAEVYYNPLLPFDMSAEVSAINVSYNNEILRNVAFKAKLENDILKIADLKFDMAGDTSVAANAELIPYKDKPIYNADVTLSSADMMQFLKLVNVEPAYSSAKIYKKLDAVVGFEGDLNKLNAKISKMQIDKSSVTGNVAWGFEEKPLVMANLDIDLLNLDEYIAPDGQKSNVSGWRNNLKQQLARLTFFDSHDVILSLQLGMGIFEKVTFEELSAKIASEAGKLSVEALSVGNLATAKMSFNGIIQDFLQEPVFEGFSYDFNIAETATFAKQFALPLPDVDMQKFAQLAFSGFMQGILNELEVKNKLKSGNVDASYHGKISKQADAQSVFDGKMVLHADDFVEFLNSINIAYNPQTYSLGLLDVSAEVAGNFQKCSIKNLLANVGADTFEGNLTVDYLLPRPKYVANLKIDNFDAGRYFYNNNGKAKAANAESVAQRAAFLPKPNFDKEAINYAFYNTFDADVYAQINKFNAFDVENSKAVLNLSLLNGLLKVSDFKSTVKESPLTLNGEWLMVPASPAVKAEFALKDFDAYSWFNGSVYAVSKGKIDCNAKLDAKAESFDHILTTLSGEAELSAADSLQISGWDVKGIYNDLIARDAVAGLEDMLLQNLKTGSTLFDKGNGKILFKLGNFQVAETFLYGNNYTVQVFGEGNLPAWTMNLKNNLKYDNPSYLPSFDFYMTGSMEKPNVSVSIIELKKIFADMEEEKALQEQVAKDDELKRLKDLLDAQEKLVRNIKTDSETLMVVDITARKGYTTDVNVQKSYDDIYAKLKTVNETADKILADIEKAEYTAENVEAISKENADNIRTFNELQKNFDLLYAEDLKNRLDFGYKQLTDTYSMADAKLKTFKRQYTDSVARFSAIDTNYVVNSDQKVQRLTQDVEVQAGDILALNNKIYADYLQIKNSKDIVKQEEYAKGLINRLNEAKQYLETMQKSSADLLNYLDEVVEREKKLSAEKQIAVEQKAEERAERAEESAQMVVNGRVVVTGKKNTPKNVIQKLDFSAADNKVVRPDKNAEEEKDNSQDAVLKPASSGSGAVSGKIIRK